MGSVAGSAGVSTGEVFLGVAMVSPIQKEGGHTGDGGDDAGEDTGLGLGGLQVSSHLHANLSNHNSPRRPSS